MHHTLTLQSGGLEDAPVALLHDTARHDNGMLRRAHLLWRPSDSGQLLAPFRSNIYDNRNRHWPG